MTALKFLGRFQTLTLAIALPLSAQAALDTNRIAQITGLSGTWNAAEGVFKITSPRNDVKIAVDRWTMPPVMGLASWARSPNKRQMM